MAACAFGQTPFDGITLIAPQNSTEIYALDINQTTVNTWSGAVSPAAAFAYMLPDGSIMRPCKDADGQFPGSGAGGRVQWFAADGTLLWDYYFSNEEHLQHHDIAPMPNGHVLILAWERKSNAEAIAAGRQSITTDMWPTLIVEVEPVGSNDANILWEWHLWDHIIQDVDANLPNYGVVADHPELININFATVTSDGDWVHENAVDYDEMLDQIVFSSKAFNEFYIIDHSTTMAEAAGHAGGTHGKGGDVLYRWGNPQAYDRGTSADKHYYTIHGATWIHCGLPGAGHVMTFNNGTRGTGGNYSSAEEIAPPRDAAGNYVIDAGEPFGPDAPAWIYGNPDDQYFYAGDAQGGAYRMPNGNTLITAPSGGIVFEVSEAGDTVWSYAYGTKVCRAPRYWLVDQNEFAEFSDCMGGPDVSADCIQHDRDCDDDADLTDFASLQAMYGEYTGPAMR